MGCISIPNFLPAFPWAPFSSSTLVGLCLRLALLTDDEGAGGVGRICRSVVVRGLQVAWLAFECAPEDGGRLRLWRWGWSGHIQPTPTNSLVAGCIKGVRDVTFLTCVTSCRHPTTRFLSEAMARSASRCIQSRSDSMHLDRHGLPCTLLLPRGTQLQPKPIERFFTILHKMSNGKIGIVNVLRSNPFASFFISLCKQCCDEGPGVHAPLWYCHECQCADFTHRHHL